VRLLVSSSGIWMASSMGASLRFLVMRPCPIPSVIELPSRSIFPSLTYLHSWAYVSLNQSTHWVNTSSARGERVRVENRSGRIGEDDLDGWLLLLEEETHTRQGTSRPSL
jgi:hypothetical protein